MVEKPRVVRLEGDWDIARRDELERLLGPVSDAPSEVILDLASVNYADSTILAELVVLRNRRRTKNLPLPRLVIGSPQVRRLFSISGLDQAFPTYDSVPDAQAAASAE